MTPEQTRACEELLKQFGWTPGDSERWFHPSHQGWGFTFKNALLKVVEGL